MSKAQIICERFINSTQLVLDFVNEYVDLDYMMWIRWLLSPIILTFVILPAIILILIYFSSLCLYIYRAHRQRLIRRFAAYVEQGDFWKAGRETVATIWDAHAWLWHGYELWGLENLPLEGGALLVYYHGALPLDYYYLVGRVLLLKEVVIHSVVDNFLFKLPGLKLVLDVFCCTPGTVEICTEHLKEGKILGIAPGGVYEAQFGDHNYKILWRQRLGFAKTALQANVPILPVFTENIREAFRVFPFFESFFLKMWIKTRLPLRPLFGGFPVRLRTHIGEPIYPEEGMSPEELRERCERALENMIATHQRLPGSITRGILDRFWSKPRSGHDD